MTMGSRIAVMRDGRIQQVGEPLEIYERPRNLFVANFIGTPPMNFVRATLEPEGRAAASGFTLPLPHAVRPVLARKEGLRVVLGIRPENIVDAREAHRGPTALLPVEIEFVEPLGDEVIVHGRVGEELLLCKLGPDRVPEVGSRLEVAIELEKMHVFDAETELRLTA
jgi:multiple sugar transport system ATP-binding protein